MLRAERGAARRRLELRVVPMPAGSDPAELLERDGATAVQELAGRSVAFVRFRVERALAAGDLSTAEGRDRVLAELAPAFEALAPGAMRMELEKLVASRLEVPERTVASLLATGAGERASGPGDGAAATEGARRISQAAGVALDARERSERAFLALCLTMPDRGREALADLDLDAHFADELTRRAAGHLRANLDAPAAGVDDADLAALLAELSVRASELPAQPAQLEVERLQLELARVDREIAAARASGRGGLSELGAERRRVKESVEAALARVLEETASGRE
jgi:DNA primase